MQHEMKAVYLFLLFSVSPLSFWGRSVPAVICGRTANGVSAGVTSDLKKKSNDELEWRTR